MRVRVCCYLLQSQAVKPEMMGSLCISAAISGGKDAEELMSFMPLCDMAAAGR